MPKADIRFSLNEQEIACAGLDRAEVLKVVRELAKYGALAKKMGLTVFGGSGSGQLRFDDHSDLGPLVVAFIPEGNFDGGDGHVVEDAEGLLRGE